MGHENHTVMSPAHRRNQNPASPSASFFKRSSTFPREEPDLSWVALFRRHRFLLLTLALLAFLCTVYLYFAIKLGADSCSGLIGKDEALCRLKKSKGKSTHGHRARRMLLNLQEPSFEPMIHSYAQIPTHTDSTTWAKLLIEDRAIQSVLVLGCTGKNSTEYLSSRSSVLLSGIGCKEKILVEEGSAEFSPDFLQIDTSLLFDLMICEKCNMLEFINDESKFRRIDRLLSNQGFFLWSLDTAALSTFTLSLRNLQLRGWSCLSRVDGMVLWQKLWLTWNLRKRWPCHNHTSLRRYLHPLLKFDTNKMRS